MSARSLAWVVPILLVVLVLVPSAASPVGGARAWTSGPVACSTTVHPTSDGAIAPGEYADDYFDAATDLLVYLACDNSTTRLLHVGIVSPWTGWVGVLVQSSETWDGRANEVRIAFNATSSALEVMDAYANVTSGSSAPDSTLGGTSDVVGATAGTQSAARVYEFAIPLNGTDPYDSRLRSDGPFTFALEYSEPVTDLASPPSAVSGLQSFAIQSAVTPAAWTTLELTAGVAPTAPGTATFLVALRDASGYPIPSVQIEVFLRSAFGMYDAGAVATNEQGVGEVTYQLPDNGTYFLGVAYTGGDGLLASAAWRDVGVSSPYTGGGVGLALFDIGGLDLMPVEALVVTVVAGVWAAYAYAFYVTWASMRKPPKSSTAEAARPFYRNEIVLRGRDGK